MQKLPWTTYNNPCGWIEPTTHCQLKCKGCYRGLDKKCKREHQPMSELAMEIEQLIDERGIKLLTIAGGEPLLYPELDKLIDYAKNRGLYVRLLTNGVALKKIPKADEIIVHSDKLDKFTDLLKGKLFGFCWTISKAEEAERLLNYAKEHPEISRVVLSAKWNFKDDNYELFGKLCGLVHKIYNTEPIFWQGKELSNKISWLYFRHRKWKAWRTYLKQIWRCHIIPFGQMITLVNFPKKTKRGYDLCKGCPDAMIYKGKLIPSCLLNKIKRGEKIWFKQG